MTAYHNPERFRKPCSYAMFSLSCMEQRCAQTTLHLVHQDHPKHKSVLAGHRDVGPPSVWSGRFRQNLRKTDKPSIEVM